MKLRIGIYLKGIKKRREIMDMVGGYMNEIGLDAEISHIGEFLFIMQDILGKSVLYDIMIICLKDEVKFISTKSPVFPEDHKTVIIKASQYPVTRETIEGMLDLMFRDVSTGCPRGHYGIVGKKAAVYVEHSDIEYFCRKDKKTVICMRDGSSESTGESLTSIKKSLPQEYFVHVHRGYIINLYNIRRIDRPKFTFIMRSGRQISVSQKVYKEIFNKFIKTVFKI